MAFNISLAKVSGRKLRHRYGRPKKDISFLRPVAVGFLAAKNMKRMFFPQEITHGRKKFKKGGE